MEHPLSPPDSGQGTAAAAAAAAARRKGMVGSGRPSSSSGRGSKSAACLFPVGCGSGPDVPFGRGSGPTDGFLSRGRGSGQATGVLPVGQGSSTAAHLFPISGNSTASPSSSMTASGAWWGLDNASPTWENNLHPPGGFMGILNSHASSHHAPFKAPRSADVGGSFATMDASSPSDVEILLDKQPTVVHKDDENVRTERRIMWTPNEDERLMSAWIKHSTDSTTGADRKGEAYWGDVIEEYNKETPPQRKRNAKQAKDRWHKINRWCDLFESDYVKARRVFTSGYNDQMWMDAAENFYLDHKLGPFVIKNVWKVCREVVKWKTYNENLKNARKRKSYHLEEDLQNVESEDEMPSRPIGQKAAKKAALAAKCKSKAMGDDGKSKESAINVEKLDKFRKIQEEANANRMKVLELQQKLSSDKIETTRVAHKTAQENKESKRLEMEGKRLEMEGKKLEKESKMMDAYNRLISQDTSSMTHEEKAERVAAMKCLRKMLFPEII